LKRIEGGADYETMADAYEYAFDLVDDALNAALKILSSTNAVEQVTWNDDGTMTLVIRGHVEPVRNGDFVVYVKT
jgi:hypothetical protein